MICSHCEKEVEEYAQKRDKICGPCYRRMMNCLSRGKEYIMYKNLTEAEKTEIDLRLQNYKKSKNQESKVSNSKCVELANKAKQEELINKDIEEAFNKKGYIIPKDFSSVRGVFEQLDVLLSNYIDKYLNAEEIYNKLECDYRHAKEHYATLYNNDRTGPNSLVYLEKRELWEERHNILLEKRRPVKNVIIEHNLIKEFLASVNSKAEVKNNFTKALINLRTTGQVVHDGEYKAQLSNLVELEDFCIGNKSNKKQLNKYHVEIVTLYKGSKSQFVRYALAETPEEAKQKVIDFIQSQPDKFKFVWNDRDIRVTKIDTALDTKYCI